MGVAAHEAFMNRRCENGVGVAHQTIGDLAEVKDDRDERVDVAPKEGAVLELATCADLPVGVHLERPLIGHIQETHGLSMSRSPKKGVGG